MSHACMHVFRSHLEDLMVAEELLFDATSGFGSVYKRFLAHSIAHPAKMNTRLTEFLIERFTVKGDLVLDPMAGSGQTGVISALHGRDAVCVDIEKKFFGWMEKAKRKVQRQQTLAVKGRIHNICGDARQLSGLLEKADVVVTSPPYEKSINRERQTENPEVWQRIKDMSGGSFRQAKGYSSNPKNIGNLKHGCVDAVISSPPYAEGQSRKAGGMKGLNVDPNFKAGCKVDLDAFEGDNIGALKYGVDVVVTSPPYADTNDRKNRKMDSTRGIRNRALDLPENRENIDNLSFVDTVITSPPYEKQLAFHDTDFMIKTAKERSQHYKNGTSKGHFASAEAIKRGNEKLVSEYSHDPSNIGNLQKETYLSAMLKVYREMFLVLKPDGKAIIVIKPFIRNKKVVDLPFHTWLLLKKAGFKLVKLFKLRLKTQSFWRILYSKKHPEVPQIKHEYVLICQKLLEA